MCFQLCSAQSLTDAVRIGGFPRELLRAHMAVLLRVVAARVSRWREVVDCIAAGWWGSASTTLTSVSSTSKFLLQPVGCLFEVVVMALLVQATRGSAVSFAAPQTPLTVDSADATAKSSQEGAS